MSALLQQAVAAHRSNDLVEAERLYNEVLADAPDRADARYNLGLIYGQMNRPFDAVREIAAALQIKPDFGQGWFMLCEFADAIGQRELNRFAGEQAVRLMPKDGRAWLRYGLALSRMEQYEEAITAYGRAAELEPSLVKAWVNLCVTFKALGQYAEAEAAIRKALTVSKTATPDETVTETDESQYNYLHWHLALLELLKGQYREGFAHFRARFRGGTDWKRLEVSQPLWRGEDLSGKTILVTPEQGLGDVLMLARYVPLLKGRGGRVIFQVHPPLVPLFTGWPGADEVIPYGKPVESAFDTHTAIFDLPHRFGTTLETVPATVPYLPVPAPNAKNLLMTKGGSKIGVIWAGQPDNIRGRNRSIPLQLFADIFAAPNCSFFSLTRDKREGDEELLANYPVTDLGARLTDFAVTAQFMSQMDLIITCDTSTAHLAGGMGKKVWTLLPSVADWRWGLEREDSAWYPTMRLFRQSRRDVWDDVVERVKAALAKWPG